MRSAKSPAFKLKLLHTMQRREMKRITLVLKVTYQSEKFVTPAVKGLNVDVTWKANGISNHVPVNLYIFKVSYYKCCLKNVKHGNVLCFSTKNIPPYIRKQHKHLTILILSGFIYSYRCIWTGVVVLFKNSIKIGFLFFFYIFPPVCNRRSYFVLQIDVINLYPSLSHRFINEIAYV